MKIIKVQKIEIFQKDSPWVLSKNRIFNDGCFLGKLSQKRSFFDVLDRKKMQFRPQKLSFKRAQKMEIF